MLTLSKPQNRLDRITDTIQSITDSQTWEECHTEVKEIYQSIKPDLTESEQDQFLLDVFLVSGCMDSFPEFWQYMNR
jgi:hypothetical protein